MAANANPGLSTMATSSSEEDIPVVNVCEIANSVTLKWGEGAAKSISVLQPDTTLYSNAPYSFSAGDSNGDEPFIKTFGSLLNCSGGILTIGQTRYRIQVMQQPHPPAIQAKQQEESPDPGYPFIDSIYILYSKPSGNEISVIATAFAVTNTLACTAGHTVSEKNNESSQALVIDEPLFLTSVLVRNDGTIAPEEGKEEIPVSVHKFHYENDWAVLRRTDQGIFPQSIAVAKSADEVPRDGAKNKLTFYHCPVALFNDDEEFTDRLHVTPKSGSVGLIKKNSIDFQNGGFDGSCGGPYVYMGKAIAIHTLSQNSALTSEILRIHQIQQGERSVSNKRTKVANLAIVADSVAASHTSVGSGVLIHKRAGLIQCISE